jgi:hypothetical protein
LTYAVDWNFCCADENAVRTLVEGSLELKSSDDGPGDSPWIFVCRFLRAGDCLGPLLGCRLKSDLDHSDLAKLGAQVEKHGRISESA